MPAGECPDREMYWLRYTVLLVTSRVRELAVRRFSRGETRGGRYRGSHWVQRLAGKDRRVGGGSQLVDEERGARSASARLKLKAYSPEIYLTFPQITQGIAIVHIWDLTHVHIWDLSRNGAIVHIWDLPRVNVHFWDFPIKK